MDTFQNNDSFCKYEINLLMLLEIRVPTCLKTEEKTTNEHGKNTTIGKSQNENKCKQYVNTMKVYKNVISSKGLQEHM